MTAGVSTDRPTDLPPGRPLLFTREQHQEALDWYRPRKGEPGAFKALCARYGISSTGMRHLLKRAQKWEQKS